MATLNFFGPSKVRYLHFSRAIYDILLSSSQKEEKEYLSIKNSYTSNKSTQGISIQILTNPEFTPFLSKLEKTPFKKSEKFKLFFITY